MRRLAGELGVADRVEIDLGRIVEWVDEHDGRLVATDLRLGRRAEQALPRGVGPAPGGVLPRGANWLRRQVAEAATSAPLWDAAADSGSAAAGWSPASAREAPVPIGGWRTRYERGEPPSWASPRSASRRRGGRHSVAPRRRLGGSRKPPPGRGFPW